MSRVEGAVSIDFGGERFELLPERAVLWPRLRSLLIADAHVGKGAFFRRQSIAVPSGSSRDTLARLGRLLTATGAERVVSLGDFLHAPPSPATLAMIDAWRLDYPTVALDLLPGNHDRHLEPLLQGVWRRLDEPQLAGFRLLHEPDLSGAREAEGLAFAGHVHPVIHLSAGRGDHLRGPAFIVHHGQLILPAFGEFTGGWPVRLDEVERAWLAGPGEVMAIR